MKQQQQHIFAKILFWKTIQSNIFNQSITLTDPRLLRDAISFCNLQILFCKQQVFRCTILLIASGKNPLGEIGSQLLTCDQFNVLKQLKSLFLCIRQEDDNLIYIPLLSITNVLNLCRQSELAMSGTQNGEKSKVFPG